MSDMRECTDLARTLLDLIRVGALDAPTLLRAQPALADALESALERVENVEELEGMPRDLLLMIRSLRTAEQSC